MFQWQTLPLIGNVPSSEYHYKIYVYTGFKGHSDTDSNVYFILNGAKNDTGVRTMSDGTRKVSL